VGGSGTPVPNILLLSTLLSGNTLPGNSYFLLERGDDTVSNVSADQIFSDSLSNTGAILRLFDPADNMIDSANNNGGSWPAGHDGSGSPPYCSMERRLATVADSDTSWFTNNNDAVKDTGLDANGDRICGTPGGVNWAYSVTATPTRTAARTKTKTRTPTRTPILGVVSSVVINEFLPYARSDWNGDGMVNSGDEFIEIKNLSTSTILLSGWRLDDQQGDSSPFTLPSVSIEPGARLVYFASETHLLLSNAGETVRLYRSNGQIADAFTYGVVQTADQTWCRFPDGFNFSWTFGCEPTPQEANRLVQTISVDNQSQSRLCLSKTILPELYQAECMPSGLDMWSRSLWNLGVQFGYPRYIQPNEQLFIIE
jgi:hypothetical protein